VSSQGLIALTRRQSIVIGPTGDEVASLPDGVASVGSWSPDGRRLLLNMGTGDDSSLAVWELATGALALLPDSMAGSGAWSHDSNLLAYTEKHEGDDPRLSYRYVRAKVIDFRSG